MPVSLISNAPARYAQTALQKQNDAITLSTQKLTSGSRVTNAGDDAASLAVGTSLKIENAGLNSAIQNAISGTSMLQIADGALGQISDLLSRMQALATEASNAVLDDGSRALVDTEFQGLLQEVNRLASVTTFNGVKLLAGVKDYKTTAATSLTGDGIADIRYDQNVMSGNATLRYSYDPTTESITLSRVDGGTTQSQTIDLTALLDTTAGAGNNMSGSAKLDVGFSQLGVTLTLGAGFDRTKAINADPAVSGGDIGLATPAFVAAATGVSTDVPAALAALTTGYDATTGALSLPLETDTTNVTLGAVPGVSYSVNGAAPTASGAASDALDPTANSVDVYVDVAGVPTKVGTFTTGAVTAGTTNGTLTVGAGAGLLSAVDTGKLDATRLVYKVGVGITAGQDTIAVEVPAMTTDALGLTGASVNNAIAADGAIDIIKAAQQVLNQGRANVGAQQVRMDEVNSNLGITVENNDAARSSLLDVDVPAEITTLTNSQAMMQASVAMLSKANQIPSMLLDMLKTL